MSKLRERLDATIATDVTENGTPTRDWCRAASRYQHSYQMLMLEERERLKLRVLMTAKGTPVLDDAEYQQALSQLAIEALGTLPQDQLIAELERRGALAEAGRDDTDDDID